MYGGILKLPIQVKAKGVERAKRGLGETSKSSKREKYGPASTTSLIRSIMGIRINYDHSKIQRRTVTVMSMTQNRKLVLRSKQSRDVRSECLRP